MHKSLDQEQECGRKWRIHPFLSVDSCSTDPLECGVFCFVFPQKNLRSHVCAETHTGYLVKGYSSAKGCEDGLTGSETDMGRDADSVA